jgi:Mg2+/Co2+ transporter CorB
VESIPLSALFTILGVLLVLSGFFSMSETAMMAANRYRLRHQAQEGHRGAKLAVALLGKTDKLLGVILLGNTLINAAAATLTGYIALAIFGTEKWALEAGTLFVTFALLIVSEITPKVIGATYADRITPTISYAFAPLLKLLQPIVWFLNLFVGGLLRLFRLSPSATHQAPRMSPEELRTLVLEGGNFIPQKHLSILLNLFDLEAITVEDVMTPRASIEALDLAAPWDDVMTRLSTCYHTRLPVYREDPGSIIGILHMRRVIAPLQRGELSSPEIEAQIQGPYYIPARTPVLAQLQFFQENRQRIGLVVDEYGEVLGLVTLEDILEEIIGEFTTSTPSSANGLHWSTEGSTLIEGSRSLREINRKLGTGFPLDGPKTLNGLILEHFQDIPETGVTIKVSGVPIEIIQTQDKSVKVARIFQPVANNDELT